MEFTWFIRVSPTQLLIINVSKTWVISYYLSRTPKSIVLEFGAGVENGGVEFEWELARLRSFAVPRLTKGETSAKKVVGITRTTTTTTITNAPSQ